jgi:hypothetical protein
MSRGPIPDKPQDRPTVPEVLRLVVEFYAKPGNEAGGNLHVVLDDGNLEDQHLEAARKRAWDSQDTDAVVIADLMLDMTRTQRRRVYVGSLHTAALPGG